MARETNTRELVREIALESLNQGEKPTQAMIRQIILEKHGRTASPNLVMTELNKVMVGSAALNAKRFALPDLPSVVADSITSIWEAACDQANQLVAGKINAVVQRELSAEQSILACESKLAIEKTIVIGLKHDIDLSSQTLEHKASLLIDIQNDLHNIRAKYDASIERNHELSADKIRMESMGAQRLTEIETNSRIELERLRTEHEKILEQITVKHSQEEVTWDGMRKHLLNQTDQIRQAAKNTDESQRLKIADLELRTGMLTKRANDTQDENSKQRGVIETLKEQILKIEASERNARALIQKAEIEQMNNLKKIENWISRTSPELSQEFMMMFIEKRD